MTHFKFSAVYVLCPDCISDLTHHPHAWAQMSGSVSLVVYGSSDLNITGRTHVPEEEQVGFLSERDMNHMILLCIRRSNWILHRKCKYLICCLREVILKIERSIKQQIKYFNFRSKTRLDHPVL